MKRISNLLISASLACGVFALPMASLAGGDIYTWTDENGTKHFGERPPVGQRDFKMLKKGRITDEFDEDASKEKAATPTLSVQRKPAAEEKRSPVVRSQPAPDAEETALDERQTSLEEQVRKLNCEKARKRLKTLSERARFTTQNEKGETVVMSDEEVEEQRSQARKIASESC